MVNGDINTGDELLDRALRGDTSAFAALLAAYSRPLSAHIEEKFRTIPRGSLGVSPDDLRQDVFELACRAFHSFQPRQRGSFFAWLCTIADNRLSNLKRSSVRERRRHVDHYLQLARVFSRSSRDNPLSHVASQDVQAALRNATERLPTHYQQILVLHFGQGIKVSELASIIGKSPTATHNQLRRAMDALREQLGKTSNYFSTG